MDENVMVGVCFKTVMDFVATDCDVKFVVSFGTKVQ
jgi:hypothetical protein